ncbi:MAG: hypothetical protein QOE87_2050, partial [Gaiellales bacterium]|nr:hypothetical protein [Gaiellales bacterium]
AERAVTWLVNQGFAAQHLTILGVGLRYVERVTGRATLGRSALQGGMQGAFLGLWWGLFLGLFISVDDGWGWVVLYGLVAGILLGALFSVAYQGARRGRRDFSSTAATVADRYEVQADDGVADEAARLVEAMPRS